LSSVVSGFKRWWYPEVPNSRVAIFRTIAYLFIFVDVFITTAWVSNHAYIPAELYQPLFIGRLLSLPEPTTTFVLTVKVLLLVCAAGAALGFKPRITGVLVAVLYLQWMVIAMSYGKVDHDRFAFLLALFVLPTVPDARWDDDTPSEAAGWALRMIQIGVVATYFLAAFAKLRFGGIEWLNGATLVRAVMRRGTYLVDPITLANPWILHAAQWFLVGFELMTPLLLTERFRKPFVAAAFTFHAITYASITIVFLPHVVCLLTFLELERLVPRLKSRLVTAGSRASP
jgi:hypothetical protein